MFQPRQTRPPVEEDDPFDFPDLPDSFSDQAQSRAPSSSTSTSNHAQNQNQGRKGLQSTVLGSGPGGIGVITKLNTKKPPTITHGSIKLKNKAVAKTWEDELDFEGDWGGTLKLKSKGVAAGRKVEMEEGGEMDGFDDDDQDWEGTLKSKLKPMMGTIKLGDVKGKEKEPSHGHGLPPRKVLPDADLDDLGFDLDEDIQVDKGKAKTPKKVPPPSRFFVRPSVHANTLPGPDALDDLDVFDFNEDEATIKASTAMKALLPPPRIRPTNPAPLANAVKDKEDDLGMDDDFALPLNLTNLTLATRSEGVTRHGPRASIASTNTDWNSPTTSTSNDRWDSTPPSKRFSETSATSLSDGLNSSKPMPQTPSSQVEDEDMEDGLVLPSKHFFKSTSKRELNSMLDRKRRPEYASTSASPSRSRQRPAFEDLTLDGLEDGLVFNDPKSELTTKRLVKSKEARSQIPIPTRRSPSSKPFSGMPPPSIIGRDSPSKREKETQRERTQSNVGMGHRSHSTGNTTLHGSPSFMASNAQASSSSQFQVDSGLPLPSGSGFKAFFSPTRPKSPLHSPAPKERSRSGQAYIPLRIPQTPERTPGQGLRHQKSSSHLPSPTHQFSSSGLVRKQSLSSLQDQQPHSSVSSLHSLAEEPVKPGYATSSGSRLRDATHASSSKVKSKQRLPLHGVFPSASSSSSSRISGLPPPGPSSSTRSRLLHAQMKRRPYGDGTELESIEDLVVEEEEGRGSWNSSARSKISNRPSVRSVFPDKGKEKDRETKTRSGFSTHSNTTIRDKGKCRDTGTGSEITIKGSDKEGSWGRKRGKRMPLLIKHLGGVDKRKVVGEMTWNPTALRWEGNESALQDFDNVPITSSARPALITHPDHAHGQGQGQGTSGGSPTNPNSYHTSAGTVKIVGNMQFDPQAMRWISLNPEDEVDPFGDIEMTLADDEGLRDSRDRKRGGMAESEVSSARAVSSVYPDGEDGEVEVDEELKAECGRAEERHRREVRGFVGGGSWSRSEERREEKRLWEIRNLARA